jgi:hypothetical protein
MASHAAIFTVSLSLGVYTLYHLFSSSRAPRAAASAAASAPPVAHDEFLSLLTEVRGAVEAECRAVSAALSLAAAGPADAARAGALREHARARVQAALEAAQAAALSARGVSAAQAERALAHWEGAGRSSDVAAVARDIRVAAGEWMLTQQRVLGLLEGFFRARADALVEAAQRHAEERGGGGGGGARFSGFDLEAAAVGAMEAGKAFLVAQGGLSLDRLQAVLESPAYAKVRRHRAPLPAPPRSCQLRLLAPHAT